MLFPNTLPEIIIGGSKCQSKPKSKIFDWFWIPAGLENDPLEHHFPPKRLQRSTSFSGPSHHGADLFAICCRKRSKDAFSSIWVRFCWILEGFWKDFKQFWIDVWLFLLSNFLFAVVYFRCSCFLGSRWLLCSRSRPPSLANTRMFLEVVAWRYARRAMNKSRTYLRTFPRFEIYQ